jgi:hypothetical protein
MTDIMVELSYEDIETDELDCIKEVMTTLSDDNQRLTRELAEVKAELEMVEGLYEKVSLECDSFKGSWKRVANQNIEMRAVLDVYSDRYRWLEDRAGCMVWAKTGEDPAKMAADCLKEVYGE